MLFEKSPTMRRSFVPILPIFTAMLLVTLIFLGSQRTVGAELIQPAFQETAEEGTEANEKEITQTGPDLVISKDDGGISFSPGDTITYTLTFTNLGPGNASGVIISETVPANTTPDISVISLGWVCGPEPIGGTICTYSIGPLTGNSAAGEVDFPVVVANTLDISVTQILNTASIGDDGANGADQNILDNVDSDFTPLATAPDLQIVKDDGGVTVHPGGTITYTVAFTNVGDLSATNVALTETVPANTVLNSKSSIIGWLCTPDSQASSICTLDLGTLPGKGGGGEADFIVDVNALVADEVSFIVNTAEIGDDEANGADPNPGDNVDSDTTPITRHSDLDVTKSDSSDPVAAGMDVAYIITVTNNGPALASSTVLTDELPSGLTAWTIEYSTGHEERTGDDHRRPVGNLHPDSH